MKKDQKNTLKVFNFSHPLMHTEVFSLLSSKYAHSLPFEWNLTSDYNEAHVILWDGVMTLKNKIFVDKIMTDTQSDKILLLIGESWTLLKDHPFIKLLDFENSHFVTLPGWNLLPEEILAALETCHKKFKNV
jgi:Ni,Fe-hydrogenase III small subunit